mmetsp:Transcript_8387/g.21616  ORF Transcript_8387/g.21616 Transcript_8387/m.21616 type:complete len:206 (+) Transcript_8387:550-1167(+)
MHGHRPHALLVVSQRRPGLRRNQVPKLHSAVVGSRDDLRVGALGQDRTHRAVVARQAVDLSLRPHVPDPAAGIPSPREQDVQRRVEGQGVHAAEVAVVVPDDLVVLQVPALDHLVQPAGKHVRVAVAHGEACHLLDVSRQCQLELARRQVPNFDCPVGGTRDEPFVAGIERQGPHPAEVAADDAVKLPRRMPSWSRPLAGLTAND